MDELADEQINNELEHVLVIKSMGNRAKVNQQDTILVGEIEIAMPER